MTNGLEIRNTKGDLIISAQLVRYPVPDQPSQLKHRRRSLWEWIVSLIVSSHQCIVCCRKEPSVSSWLQVDHAQPGDVVCDGCVAANPHIFGL